MEAADLRPDNAACSRQDPRFTASYSIVSGSSRERRQTRARSHETVIVFEKNDRLPMKSSLYFSLRPQNSPMKWFYEDDSNGTRLVKGYLHRGG